MSTRFATARLCSPPEKSLSAGDPLSGQLLRCSAFAPPALSLRPTRPPLSLRRKTLTVVLSDSCGEKAHYKPDMVMASKGECYKSMIWICGLPLTIKEVYI
ncbi:hypothetical protein F2Q68_00016577 [Brassica cretica]|uniref:Uncharacterized protein n=1 Tax=Brassica cretica TaxID=69181 RepID=A0A8S9HNU9_BRACR|nr:hypothetical protein F2Q68_00016577 [Brassica cretica]